MDHAEAVVDDGRRINTTRHELNSPQRVDGMEDGYPGSRPDCRLWCTSRQPSRLDVDYNYNPESASGLLWMQPGRMDSNVVGHARRAHLRFFHPPASSFHMHDQSTGRVIKRTYG